MRCLEVYHSASAGYRYGLLFLIQIIREPQLQLRGLGAKQDRKHGSYPQNCGSSKKTAGQGWSMIEG